MLPIEWRRGEAPVDYALPERLSPTIRHKRSVMSLRSPSWEGRPANDIGACNRGSSRTSAPFFDVKNVSIAAAITVFPGEPA
jgi:hypothetical protein